MKPYATFDAEGNPTGFYFEAVHGSKIPAEAITISDEDYLAYVQGQQWRRDPISGQRITAPLPPPPTNAELLIDIRAERNRRLSDSDWSQMPDAPLSADQLEEWRVYRQELRDFPEICDPANPVWPEMPK